MKLLMVYELNPEEVAFLLLDSGKMPDVDEFEKAVEECKLIHEFVINATDEPTERQQEILDDLIPLFDKAVNPEARVQNKHGVEFDTPWVKITGEELTYCKPDYIFNLTFLL